MRAKVVKVAIAEDEPSVRIIYARILSDSGFSVMSFEDGERLVEFIEKNTDLTEVPDVIITDYRMPKMDGIQAAHAIRATKPAVKVILASAYDVPKDAVGLFDVILKKPFGKKELLEAVSRCL